MPKRIIVAVKSDIARKGLVAIARQAVGFSVLDRKGVDELQACDITPKTVLVFDFNSLKEISEHFLKVENVNIEPVAFFSERSSNSVSTWAGNSIDINDSDDSILQLLNNFFPEKQEKKSDLLHNGELSVRERDVLKLVAMGLPNKEIADRLFISIHTVITHRKNITEKLGIKSISGLTVYAIINGIIDSDSINVNELI
jgi:DNA-binding CsgD family transcriptional regulator